MGSVKTQTLFILLFFFQYGFGQVQLLDSTRHHLRSGELREWSEFPLHAQGKKMTLHFSSIENLSERTLILRQYDVKLNWQVALNNRVLGSLHTDEKDLMMYLRIPAGVLKYENTLEIKSNDSASDDILLGPVSLDHRPLAMVLSEAFVELEIIDKETNQRIPARITITNGEGTLQTVLPSAQEPVATRPGFIYTGSGKISVGLPAGKYTVYAGRGFEYGVDSVNLALKAGEYFYKKLFIQREVSTLGWISSDTHIHTLTYSGHGDANLRERVLTIAGEGLELPVSTDHNILVDLKPFAIDNRVDKYFTSIIGNEITTKVGHFNLFPATTAKPVTDHRVENWRSLSENLAANHAGSVVILNHARDIHMGFRPFDSQKHLSTAGIQLDDATLPANAMEVINSGSQQTDIMELTRDWFGLLNSGNFLTPVGSSDSHDVSRFIVGQARTYIRGNDSDPGKIDIDEAVRSFREGKVMVSLGLLAEVTVNDKYGPGELAPSSEELKVRVKVSGPGWTKADRITLYANGKNIGEQKIQNGNVAGTKWDSTWQISMPQHDIFLAAIAEGPGDQMPFWPIAKPFQPVSIDWHPQVMALSGAVWVDADGNGSATSASAYAKDLVTKAKGNMEILIKSLSLYDESIAMQVAAILYRDGQNLASPAITKVLRRASVETRKGFETMKKELALTKK